MEGHKDRGHAYLSASGSARWLACTASPSMEKGQADKSSDFAREGTLAHEIADAMLRHLNHEITEGRLNEMVEKLKKHRLFKAEMIGYVEGYVDYVAGVLAEARTMYPDAKLLVEERLDFSEYVPGGYGTGDAAIICPAYVHIIDLKYGRGVKVEAQDNPQLKLYGIGALKLAPDEDLLGDNGGEVRITAYQPRLYSTSTSIVTVNELLTWASDYVRPRAALAMEGKGDLLAGDHCRFCKAKPFCRAYRDWNMEIMAKEFSEPKSLTIEEIIEIYEALPRLKKWAALVAEYLKTIALSGREVPGYKVVKGSTKRKWHPDDEGLLLDVLQGLDFEPDQLVNTKIKGIGEISALVSVDVFDAKLKQFLVKPPGLPTLAPDSDKRPLFDSFEQLKEDFAGDDQAVTVCS